MATQRQVQPEILGLPARERPGRRAQPRRHPAARRSLQRGLRGGRQQHQGHAGDPPCLWPAAVRRGPRGVLPHHHRHRRQSQCRGGRGDRHRGRLDQPRRRRHQEDRQAGDRLRHRRERRHHDGRQGGARRQGLSAVGFRAEARGMRLLRAVGLDQVRRERHHHRPRLLPDRRQHVRQADPAGHLRRVRRDLGDHRRRAPRQGARRDPGDRREMVRGVEGLHGRGHRAAQEGRPVGIAADQGQYRRRPHHHRGKGVRQSREDRPQVHLYRRARAGRGAGQGPRPLLHGHLVRGRRMRDADGGGRLCRAHASRPGRAT